MDMLKIARCYTAKASNAASRGLEFKLDLMAFVNIKSQKVCAYSGLEFTENNPLTLERINNDLGYVDGNVIPVCLEWNQCRAEFTSVTARKGITKTTKALKDAENLLSSSFSARDKARAHAETQADQIREIKNNAYGVKPYIAAKSQQWWINHETTRHRQQLSIDKYVVLIDNLHINATKKGLTKLSTSQRKLEKIYVDKLANLKKIVQSSETQLKHFYKNRPSASAKIEVEASSFLLKQDEASSKLDAIMSTIDAHQERVNAVRKRLDILNLLVPILERFENLSDHEKTLIAEGLPLSTSTYKLMRHKVGKALLVKGE